MDALIFYIENGIMFVKTSLQHSTISKPLKHDRIGHLFSNL
jgi:hypothetical protein